MKPVIYDRFFDGSEKKKHPEVLCSIIQVQQQSA